jgi:hypothetical protein
MTSLDPLFVDLQHIHVFTLITLLKLIPQNTTVEVTPPDPTTPTVPILGGSVFVINTGQSSRYDQFLHRGEESWKDCRNVVQLPNKSLNSFF